MSTVIYMSMSADEFIAGTGAVIPGRRWDGDLHDGAPVFVLTLDVPDEPPPGSIQYMTDVDECAAEAREAAGDAATSVLGAGAAHELLSAGELDELALHVVPVLLGKGRRLFEHLRADPVAPTLVGHFSTPEVQHLRY